jgi:catechol 2,3-dioxygenase-like lactoylglutathione lyase family enzyme
MKQPALNLVILRSADLERSARFYTALGLRLTHEKHGKGPEHLVATTARIVLEIYPQGRDYQPGAVRLGFRVANLDALLPSLIEAGGSLLGSTQAGRGWLLVADPDGHQIELAEFGESGRDMEEWLLQTFSFPDVKGRKVLIAGLGGGCDIILALAVARLLPAGARTVVYGNTKKADEPDLEEVSRHIRRVPREVRALKRGRTHGTTAIDRSVPRGDEGCPWIFLLPPPKSDGRLVKDLNSHQFDIIFAVDTGGDSLLGSPEGSGRDKRMLRILARTERPLYHIVVAPGSAGEGTYDDLRRAMKSRPLERRYRGCFSLEPVLGVLRTLSMALSPGRTPRIILAAADGTLPAVRDRVIVPRGCRPRVPSGWLTRGFVFTEFDVA